MTCSNCGDSGHRRDRCPKPARGVAPSPLRALAATVATAATAPLAAAFDPDAGLDRWERVAREASRLAPGPLGFLLWVDGKRIAAGMPPFSPWWKWSIGDFYASGKPWGFWLVGRGGGKSTTLEGVSAAHSFFTARKVPPGQTWTWPFISVGPDDANRRISGIAAVYRSIGLPIIGEEDEAGSRSKEGVKVSRAPRGALDLLDARGNPILLASIAGTIGNVSGPSTIGLTIDEAAKLHDKSTNANPLTEIIASGAQTSRARAGWIAIVCSSAWDLDGAHWQTIEAGPNDSNYIATIGEAFLPQAVDGFLRVAVWEEMGGNLSAGAAIRAHAAVLRASSPMVPTWVANPTLGNPDGAAWEGAALASRRLVDVLPPAALGGLPRHAFWLRENGSVPLDRTANGGANAEEQARFAAECTDHVMRLSPPSRTPGAPMPHPLAPPGDARHAGPAAFGPTRPASWRTRRVM